jgi:hypothetical protein
MIYSNEQLRKMSVIHLVFWDDISQVVRMSKRRRREEGSNR